MNQTTAQNVTDPITPEDTEDSSQKQAACLSCRKSKVRCIRGADAIVCRRCGQTGAECVVPEYHVGRYKGVKNKRSGLDKAIHQVEEAVKRARTGSNGLDSERAKALEKLLNDTQKPLNVSPMLPVRPDIMPYGRQMASQTPSTTFRHASESSGQRSSSARHEMPTSTFAQPEHDGEATVNNADNPLQLLAIASAIPGQSTDETTPTPSSLNKVSPSSRGILNATEDEVQHFFKPMSSRFDYCLVQDPIEQGLVTLQESEMLFNYFHHNLAHTRWGLDKIVHTADYVRTRSTYLFTSIMAASALFLPQTGALSIRLNNHVKHLAKEVVTRGYKSVEIVLAYMINIPWMLPGQNWARDDETCSYLSTAMTIALDLSLNKIVTPSSTMRPPGVMNRIAHSECIDARRALELDGHHNIDVTSEYARRLLRARERTWLALFVLDRGVCLARGRPWTVPTCPLIDTCDSWHLSDIADEWDGSLVASAVLRRDFGDLVNSIRTTCDNNQLNFGDHTDTVKVMTEKIEGFFTQWYNTWSFQIKQADGSIPPYVSILVSHGKLSAYARVINHPTASPEIKQFFRTAGLASALNVMWTAVQSEQKLRSMPNNSVIMIAFAACFVLGLSTVRKGGQIYIAPHAQQSIEETANVLERLGSWPSHRKGASVLFGRHIKRILRQHISAGGQVKSQHTTNPVVAETGAFHSSEAGYVPTPYMLQSTLGGVAQSDFPGFDSMTDDQLINAIQNARNGADSFNVGLQPDDNLFMDWLEWPNMTW